MRTGLKKDRAVIESILMQNKIAQRLPVQDGAGAAQFYETGGMQV